MKFNLLQILIMGILKLMDFLKSKAPKALTSTTISSYRDKVLTIDASNWIYQFLIKTQTIRGRDIQMPVDWMGNQTGHLIGMLSRVELCFANKITPIWVFDGKPPDQKIGELKKRKKMKQKSQQLSQKARQDGQVFDLLKMSKRSVKITQQEKQDAKTLIRLIGLPVIEAPSEAEPQCTSIVKQGLAYGTISEDMDNLAFGCTKMIRGFNQKSDCVQISLDQVLQQIDLSQDQFVDFCILCGCDYTSKIKNIGPVKAYQFIKTHKNIQQVLAVIASDKKMSQKYVIPDDFNHLRARKLFLSPDVQILSDKQTVIKQFQKEKLVSFLQQKQFSAQRIDNWLQRVKKTNMVIID